MKKIVLFSDVHHGTEYLDAMVRDNMDADYFFFLGDGLNEVMSYFPRELSTRLVAVEGNCDSMYQSDRQVDVEDKKFFLTHGNKYHVKSGMFTITLRGEEIGADVVCFGHTHAYHDEMIGGIRYVNPGALGSFGSYALIIVENGEIFVVREKALV